MSKPTKAPAFQFYPSDFVSDMNVAVMTNQERGCYIMLICFCWKEGSIPNSIKSIAKILRETEQDMMLMWQAISPCFIQSEDGERLRHPRLDAEREKQAAHSAKQSEGGKAAMRKRWGNRENQPLPLWQHGADSASQVGAPGTATVVKEIKTKSPKLSQHIAVPDGVDPEIYADFIKIRTKKDAPFTSTALKGFVAEAKKAKITLDEAFSVCCNKGWVGFEATWYANLKRSQSARQGNFPSKGPLDELSMDDYKAHMMAGLKGMDESIGVGVVVDMEQNHG